MRNTPRTLLILALASATAISYPQSNSLNKLLSDSTLRHGSVSFYAADAESGEMIYESAGTRSLTPASIQKLITSAAALELLGPDYRFTTKIGYTGTINKHSGKLSGNIVITGGGDPSFASPRFAEHYGNIAAAWAEAVAKAGIKKIEGRVITDDSYYDFLPVPAKWLWEDAGNYYGAGAYGLSVFDNTYEIFLRLSENNKDLEITKIVPPECKGEFSNWLVAAGTSDEGYVFAAPYSTNGWLAGTVPEKLEDFALKASISDPPRLFARIMHEELEKRGVEISLEPTTVRLELSGISETVNQLAEISSPPLSAIADALNHESVNLYAEHMLKELGKKFGAKGSTEAGIETVIKFLNDAGLGTGGMFLEDGSGLSPLNSINSKELVNLLVYLKTRGKHFGEFYNSLPEAGREGTVRYYFKDPLFESRLRLKSGSMTRVRSYAGYLNTLNGRTVAFSIIINNYSGPSRPLITSIENILRELVLYK